MNCQHAFALVGITAGLLGGQWAHAELPIPPTSTERFPANKVIVVVEQNDGWDRHVSSALSCDGTFIIAGAYSDTTKIRGVVSREAALGFVNELLDLNFFELPGEYGNRKIHLSETAEGDLRVGGTDTADGGAATISLNLGQYRHTVRLAFPAYGASPALREWLKKFGDYMDANRGW